VLRPLSIFIVFIIRAILEPDNLYPPGPIRFIGGPPVPAQVKKENKESFFYTKSAINPPSQSTITKKTGQTLEQKCPESK
jgi:hypothetical protein